MGAAREFFKDVGAEMSRLGTQGAMELASALLGNGSAFVPYGPGQYTPDVAPDAPAIEATPEPPKQEQDQGMER
jgi:hypothetical protein